MERPHMLKAWLYPNRPARAIAPPIVITLALAMLPTLCIGAAG